MNSTETGFTWRSQPVFVIVSVGATLSLNNFLTFPLLAGQNGDGAFLLLYILFLIMLGIWLFGLGIVLAYSIWNYLVRYIIPVLLLVIILAACGIV